MSQARAVVGVKHMRRVDEDGDAHLAGGIVQLNLLHLADAHTRAANGSVHGHAGSIVEHDIITLARSLEKSRETSKQDDE